MWALIVTGYEQLPMVVALWFQHAMRIKSVWKFPGKPKKKEKEITLGFRVHRNKQIFIYYCFVFPCSMSRIIEQHNQFCIFCLSAMPTEFLVRMVQYIALSFSDPGSSVPFVKTFPRKIPFKFPKNNYYFSRNSMKGQLPMPLLLILRQPWASLKLANTKV